MRRSKEEWLKVFQEQASSKEGQCLSVDYVKQSSKLTFRCADGHHFSAQPMNVLHRKSWCPHCAGNAKLSIQDVQEAAAKLGGVCLSDTHESVHKPMEFQCANGHRFKASATSVRTMEAFCMECQKLTIEEFQRLTVSIGYTLLSDTYVNNYTKIRVLCDFGHLWYVQPKHLKEGRRCPGCRMGVHQMYLCSLFNAIMSSTLRYW